MNPGAINDRLQEGFGLTLDWLGSEVMGWYGLGLWVALFLTVGLTLIVWRLVRRFF